MKRRGFLATLAALPLLARAGADAAPVDGLAAWIPPIPAAPSIARGAAGVVFVSPLEPLSRAFLAKMRAAGVKVFRDCHVRQGTAFALSSEEALIRGIEYVDQAAAA